MEKNLIKFIETAFDYMKMILIGFIELCFYLYRSIKGQLIDLIDYLRVTEGKSKLRFFGELFASIIFVYLFLIEPTLRVIFMILG